MARAMLRLASCLLLLCVCACGDPAREPAAAPPISGAVLDQIQANVRTIADRNLGGVRADSLRVEKADGGARVVVHASFAGARNEGEDLQVCTSLSAAAAGLLLEGQSIEVHVLREGSVVHSCGL